jgi:hypothetical protein
MAKCEETIRKSSTLESEGTPFKTASLYSFELPNISILDDHIKGQKSDKSQAEIIILKIRCLSTI